MFRKGKSFINKQNLRIPISFFTSKFFCQRDIRHIFHFFQLETFLSDWKWISEGLWKVGWNDSEFLLIKYGLEWVVLGRKEAPGRRDACQVLIFLLKTGNPGSHGWSNTSKIDKGTWFGNFRKYHHREICILTVNLPSTCHYRWDIRFIFQFLKCLMNLSRRNTFSAQILEVGWENSDFGVSKSAIRKLKCISERTILEL